MNTLHAIYEVIQIEKKKTPDTTEILDKLRNVLEPYIYFYLIEKHGAMLQKFWESYQPPWISDNVFVIAERRAHPNFRLFYRILHGQDQIWLSIFIALMKIKHLLKRF